MNQIKSNKSAAAAAAAAAHRERYTCTQSNTRPANLPATLLENECHTDGRAVVYEQTAHASMRYLYNDAMPAY